MPREAFQHARANAEWCNDKEPQTMSAKHIGKGSDGKWYGWSHRAFSAFRSRGAASKFAHKVS